MPQPSQSFTRNRLLGIMSAGDFAFLQPHLERVGLAPGYVMFEANEPIEHVYFLEGGVGSIVAPGEEGEVEIGLFGREGLSGVAVLLDAESSPHRAFIQVDSSTALRIRSPLLRDACRRSPSLHTLLLRYVQTLSVQAAQTAASNANFALPGRLARWLLMCHDRVDGDTIALTHEFMAMMLAVRRSGVTVTLHTIEGAGAISARRGVITVTDRERLEHLAGKSYGIAEAEYRKLIGPFGKQGTLATPSLRFATGQFAPRRFTEVIPEA